MTRKKSDLYYEIETPDRRKGTRVCHVNLLKPYYDRDCGRAGCLGGTKLESGSHVTEVKSVLAASSVENSLTRSRFLEKKGGGRGGCV